MIRIALISTLVSLLLGMGTAQSAELMSEYGTSGLAQALQATMRNNPAVKGKKAEVDAQRYAVDVSKAARYPDLSANANDTNDDLDGQGTIRLEQPLWTFGKITNEIKQERVRLSVEQLDLLRVQRELLENTAVAYARIDGIRQRAELSDKNIVEHETLYDRIERRAEGQLASDADVRIASSRLIQARLQRQEIRGDEGVALAELYALTLEEIGTEQPIDPAMANVGDDVEEQARLASADIVLRQKQLESARAAVDVARVASYPDLLFRAEHDFLDQPFAQDETRTGLAIVASVDGLGLVQRGRIKGAIAQQVAAEEQVRVSEEDVRRRVRVLKVNRDTLETLMVAQREAIAAVDETRESFIRQFDSGRKSWVEVLNIQRELTQSRFELSRMYNDWLVLSMRLAAISGQLDAVAGIKVQ